MLVHSLPSVGLIETNSFLVSLPPVSLPFYFVSGEGPNLIYLRPPEPGALAPMGPGYISMAVPFPMAVPNAGQG